MPRVSATDLMPEFSGWNINNGRYRLMEKLGSGAYGKVYRALDTSSSPDNPRFYAIKCLLKHPTGSEKDILQQHEISIHRKVSGHPNIVTFHGCFHDDRYVYVVMGLYSGGDLFGAITDKQWYNNQPERIKATFIQILDAIQHCHTLGIYHRDVKPENIMCSEDGRTVYLGDFGLSTVRTKSRDYGCGSSFYMSPECIGPTATGKNVGYSNRHNDIWALGVILTNLITGRNPWRLATADDPCFMAYSKNRNFLKEVLTISSGVNSLLQKVFCFPSESRISVPDLRKHILELDAFYEDQKIGLGGGESAKALADTLRGSRESNDTSYSSLDSEQYIYGTDIEESAETSSTLIDPIEGLVPPAPPTRSSVPARGTGTSTGSGTDNSNGPITPASRAVEPDVEIPDVSQEMGGINKGVTESAGKVPHESKGTLLLKTAYQRLKGL